MTCSGLPSVRDPKQSFKHSAASGSSTSSSTVSSSPKSPTSEQQQQQRHQHDSTDPVLPDPTALPVPADVTEKSFEGLVSVINGSTGADMSLEMKQQPKTTKAAVPKKKGVPQNLTPAQSAAYRKRLNVNQVCDWCRYRKIRCDRESPCNSCQHSRRECIRTPSSVLLNNLKTNPSNSTDADSSSSSSTLGGKTKRGRAGSKDGRSRKSYRSSSAGSHHSSYFSSDDDEDDEDDDNDDNSSEHADSSLALGGLGFGGLDNIAHLRNSLGQDSTQWSGYGMQPFSHISSNGMNGQGLAPSGVQLDQEYLERMRRIEILLGNVIPGAAEFIANGRDGPQPLQRQHQQQSADAALGESLRGNEKKGLTIVTQGLDQHQRDILSPQDRLARISLASPAIQTPENSWPGFHAESTAPSSPSPDYIERMKRIELLLGTVQDLPLAMTLMNQVQDQSQSPRSTDMDSPVDKKKLSKKELKKLNMAKSKKHQLNCNGQAVKRPHVAAGFAGQKPPPKLPQAIAEAALKKQNARKKRATASRVAAIAAQSSGNGSQESNSGNVVEAVEARSLAVDQSSQEPVNTDPRKVTLSPTASLGIPSVIENKTSSHMLHPRGSGPYLHQQQQYGAQPLHEFQNYPYPYQAPSPVSTIGSMTIPSFSEPIASYGSLVVPASTSPSSSATSSPRTARAESVSVDGSVHDDPRSMSTTSVDTVGSTMDQHAIFLAGQSHDQQLASYSQLVLGEGGESSMRFEFPGQALSPEAVAVALQHQQQQSQSARDAYSFSQNHQQSLLQQLQLQQLQQQYQQLQSQRPVHIGQDLGLNMNESLESLMKKNMTGSLEGFDPQTLLSAPVSTPSFGQSLYDTSANQFGAFPAQPFQGVSQTSMWTPNHSDSFAIPTHESQLSWQQVNARSQPQSLQSINISVSDSPTQAEMKLSMDMNMQSKQVQQQQQKQFGAHALFQQQSLQQHPLQQHRASISIQHQHQQSFYIPQLQDDDEDEAEDESEGSQPMYNTNTSTTDNTSNSNDLSSGKEGVALSIPSIEA